MKRIFNKHNFKVLYVFLGAFTITLIIILVLDWGLLKSLYNLYYGDSEIIDFFSEYGGAIINNSTRIATFKLVFSRMLLSVCPLTIGLFLLYFYRKRIKHKF